jgi:hypothetical protein
LAIPSARPFENPAFFDRQPFESHFMQFGEDFIHPSLVVLIATASGFRLMRSIQFRNL